MGGEIIDVYVDEATHKRLLFIAKEMDRPVQDLAETSVSEAALHFFRGRNDDPAKDIRT